MTTQTLSPEALRVIDEYLHLPFSGKNISCPYYNNRRHRVRGALRAMIGKGSPEEIVHEAIISALKERIDLLSLDNDTLKKFLVDHHIGIDCSGFVSYVLDAELRARGNMPLRKQIFFPHAKNIFRKLIVKIRPAENMDVRTLADDKNSEEITPSHVRPGDYIVFTGAGERQDRDHILLIHRVDRGDQSSVIIHYTHAFQWSTDGKYHHGVRQGIIYITNTDASLLEGKWTEQGKSDEENETWRHARSAQSVTLRRLRPRQ